MATEDRYTVVREVREAQGGGDLHVHETVFRADEVILDPNSSLAVQIPEDADAKRDRITVPLGEALATGVVEAKFGTTAAPLPVSSEAGEGSDSEHVRAVGSDSGEEHVPDLS
jgi:hypothetical protein